MVLNNLNYPLDFKFKITTLASDFNITDRNGNYVAYVRQKMFKLKEDVIVFNDESKTKELFRIQANQWIDFNASYSIKDTLGKSFGRLARKGMRSIWKSTYNVLDEADQQKFTITEDNAWVKFFDGMVGEIPIIGAFTGYFLNPSYTVRGMDGKEYFKLKKMPSFFGRRFQLDRLIDIDDEDESLVVLSFLMMVLLERARG
ncbi:LURP-one-related/scramblase family protein [Chryseobacterium terrae]|uniref:LURP-one-related n=1 Tax=Chryseobacterium terrae TaxID=3163299 RepID=A0ABW8Y2A4_9FLAO